MTGNFILDLLLSPIRFMISAVTIAYLFFFELFFPTY